VRRSRGIPRVALRAWQTGAASLAIATACASACTLEPADRGVPGPPHVTAPAVDGTVFTIVLENKNAHEVLHAKLPHLFGLSETYARADAYLSHMHPSLLNYLVMTSGTRFGVTSSAPPAQNFTFSGPTIVDQLEDAAVPWRAYMESMREPCRLDNLYPYVVNHNPFASYPRLTNDRALCEDRMVDFDEHFDADLAADKYDYMWITPNQCHNMHDCQPEVGDEWLGRVVGKILASPGYQRGGALFILFDEGSTRVFSAEANLATVVVSPKLVAAPMSTRTRFGHDSYLATVQDIFGFERFDTTRCSTPMNEVFQLREGSQPTDLCGGGPSLAP
jgi:hypothetical protein